MKTTLKLSLLAFAATLATASADYNKKEIHLADCPEPVRQTIEANSRGGVVDEVDRISIEGKEIYIAEIDLPRDIDLKVYVSGNGSLVKTREEVPLRSMPAFIREATREYGGKIDDVEKEVAGGRTTFHVEIDRKGMPDIEVVLSADGAVISETEEADD